MNQKLSLLNIAALFIVIALSLYLIYVANNLITPLFFAFLFSILLLPLVGLLQKKLKFPRIIAIITSILAAGIVLLSILLFLGIEINLFTQQWPAIKSNVFLHLQNLQHWIEVHFNISYKNQQSYISQISERAVQEGTGLIGDVLGAFTGTFLNFILIPIYTFLLMLYQDLFLNAIQAFIKPLHHIKLNEILKSIKSAIQNYIVGLLIEMVVVAFLNAIGLWIIGVDYIILLAVITGILNIIPYIGIIIATFFSVIVTLSGSPEISDIMGVIIVNIIVQVIDNNFLVPKIIGSKVSINALFSMVGVIVGGALAGIAGMFLAIPALAILKVISDHVSALKPLGMLLGDIKKVKNPIPVPIPNQENTDPPISKKV